MRTQDPLDGIPKSASLRLSVAILALIVLQGTLAIGRLRGVVGVSTSDTAYYYATARNISRGDPLPDHMVWQFMGGSRAVEIPTGEYWSPGWPFVLGGLMRLFGNSAEAALTICAVLSTLTPIVVFGLTWAVCGRLLPSLTAGVLVCLQGYLAQVFVTPDVTTAYQTSTGLGLLLFLRFLKRPSWARLVPAALLLTLPMWLRGEGFIGLLSAGLVILLAREIDSRTRWYWFVSLVVCSVVFAIPLIGYNFWNFGHANPTPRSLVPWMTTYGDLYSFNTTPSFKTWWSVGFHEWLAVRWRILGRVIIGPMRVTPFLVLLLGCVAPVAIVAFDYFGSRGKARRSSLSQTAAGGKRVGLIETWGLGEPQLQLMLLWSFIFFSAAVPLLIAPIGLNWARFTLNTTPVMCALSVLYLDTIWHKAKYYPLLLGLLVVFGSVFILPNHFRSPISDAWKAEEGFLEIPVPLLAGNHPELGRGDLVLTDDPWQVSAVLDVPTVMVPRDGLSAFQRLLAQYHPQWILAEDKSLLAGYLASATDLPLTEVMRRGNFVWYKLASSNPAATKR